MGTVEAKNNQRSMENSNHEGMRLFKLSFEFQNEMHFCQFYSTAKITTDTIECIVRELVEAPIKLKLKTISNRKKGERPRKIVLSGEFGEYSLKD